jgi:hypothetical protein
MYRSFFCIFPERAGEGAREDDIFGTHHLVTAEEGEASGVVRSGDERGHGPGDTMRAGATVQRGEAVAHRIPFEHWAAHTGRGDRVRGAHRPFGGSSRNRLELPESPARAARDANAPESGCRLSEYVRVHYVNLCRIACLGDYGCQSLIDGAY